MSIDKTLEERGNVHGDFKDNSLISQRLKFAMEEGKNWPNISDVQREALHMIAHKISRILAGDPNHKDHWHDIIGYASLVEKDL